MIQRVQSIYLLLVTIFMSFLLVLPYASIEMPGNQLLLFKSSNIYLVSLTDIFSVYKSTLTVILLILVTGIFSFCIIFFYNHRIHQMRLIVINLLLIMVLIMLMSYNIIDARSDFDGARIKFKIAMILPLTSLVFSLMAIRCIRHDEILVNSYNRIR